MGLSKPNKISVLFFFIFLLGVIGFIAYINISLNRKTNAESLFSSEDLQSTSLTIQE